MAGIDQKTVKRNIILSFSSQIISMFVGVILSIIVPKYISVEQYGYWQIFVLYIGYIGVLHFGLLDGLLLRYSQYDYNNLDRPLLRSQFKWLLSGLSLFSLIGIFISFLLDDKISSTIVFLLAIAILSKNIFTYNSYLLQLTNRIDKYAQILVCQRVVFGIIVIGLLICNNNHFECYCVAELIGDIVGCILALRYNRGLYLGKSVSLSKSILDLKQNVIAGAFLMFANWSSMLMLGFTRMLVNWNWDIELFGKISLSFSLTSFVLSFVVPVSIVMFPSLKRLDPETLPTTYITIRKKIVPLVLLSLVLYYPLCVILRLWIPEYEDSLHYLAYLMPVIVSSTIINILTNNYLKAYRKERLLLYINVFSLGLIIVLAFISTYLLNNITLLLIVTSFTMMIRSFISEHKISKIIGYKYTHHLFFEFLLCCIFIITSFFDNLYLRIMIFIGAVFIVAYLEKRYPSKKSDL